MGGIVAAAGGFEPLIQEVQPADQERDRGATTLFLGQWSWEGNWCPCKMLGTSVGAMLLGPVVAQLPGLWRLLLAKHFPRPDVTSPDAYFTCGPCGHHGHAVPTGLSARLTQACGWQGVVVRKTPRLSSSG